jgi:hypothetical protein
LPALLRGGGEGEEERQARRKGRGSQGMGPVVLGLFVRVRAREMGPVVLGLFVRVRAREMGPVVLSSFQHAWAAVRVEKSRLSSRGCPGSLPKSTIVRPSPFEPTSSPRGVNTPQNGYGCVVWTRLRAL